MTDIPVLNTDRLILRPWRDADRIPFAEQSGDPRVMNFFPGPMTPAESDALAASIASHFEQHGYGWWAVEVKGGDSFIGYVGIQHCDFPAPFTPAVAIGWRLGAEHWQEGYAHEAAEAVLRFAFEEAGLDEVVAFTVPANLASLALMERLGMEYDARDDFQHPHLPPEHRLRHHLLYRLSRERWQQQA
jgi:RimJ/RimL family protein N-acetyltransferase